MDSAVDVQLSAYLLICAGVGAIQGATGSIGLTWNLFPGFFLPWLYWIGVTLFLAGAVVFMWSKRRGS